MSLQRVLLWFVLPASVATWMLRLGRHRCAYNDPLCQRNRPCLGCYRDLFNRVKS